MSNPALSALSAKWRLKVLIYTRNLARQFAIIPASTTNLRIISRIQTKKLFAGKMLQKRLVLVVVSRHRLAVLVKYCMSGSVLRQILCKRKLRKAI